MSIFKKKPGTVASISLYGTQAAGHDIIIAFYDKDGELQHGSNGRPDLAGRGDKLCPGRSATETIFLAVYEIRQRNILRGIVEVHYDFDFGSRVASFKLEERVPYFGELKWEPDAPLVISVDAIVAASTQE
jgi:hypothetical protein